MSPPYVYRNLNALCDNPAKRHLTGKIVVTPVQSATTAEEREQVIRVASFSKDHKLLDTWVWRVTWKIPWTIKPVAATFDKVLSPKASTVRFLVANSTADRIGSCDYLLP